MSVTQNDSADTLTQLPDLADRRRELVCALMTARAELRSQRSQVVGALLVVENSQQRQA